MLDFQASCARAMGVPPERLSEQMDTIPLWFRLSNLVQQIGTGQVEYGCWVNGQLHLSHRVTAIAANVDSVTCLRTRQRLVVYAEPSITAKPIWILPRNGIVDPGSYPASLLYEDGQVWLAIDRPARGWVLHSRPNIEDNFSQC